VHVCNYFLVCVCVCMHVRNIYIYIYIYTYIHVHIPLIPGAALNCKPHVHTYMSHKIHTIHTHLGSNSWSVGSVALVNLKHHLAIAPEGPRQCPSTKQSSWLVRAALRDMLTYRKARERGERKGDRGRRLSVFGSLRLLDPSDLHVRGQAGTTRAGRTRGTCIRSALGTCRNRACWSGSFGCSCPPDV
jgi:hypothetical protein